MKNAPVAQRSLVEAIGKLNMEFSSMRIELRETQFENEKLRKELNQLKDQSRSMPALDLPALRRRTAFFCHPDRGGDTKLMSGLNHLFDCLVGMQTA